MKQEKSYFHPIVPKKGFMLIELVIVLAISSVLFVLLTSLLHSSLQTSSSLGMKIKREDNIDFAMESICMEIEMSEEFYLLSNGRLLLYEWDDTVNPHHHYIYYSMENGHLYRYAAHFENRLKEFKTKRFNKGQTLVLKDIESFNISLENKLIHIYLRADDIDFERFIAARGGQINEKLGFYLYPDTFNIFYSNNFYTLLNCCYRKPCYT